MSCLSESSHRSAMAAGTLISRADRLPCLTVRFVRCDTSIDRGSTPAVRIVSCESERACRVIRIGTAGAFPSSSSNSGLVDASLRGDAQGISLGVTPDPDVLSVARLSRPEFSSSSSAIPRSATKLYVAWNGIASSSLKSPSLIEPSCGTLCWPISRSTTLFWSRANGVKRMDKRLASELDSPCARSVALVAWCELSTTSGGPIETTLRPGATASSTSKGRP